MPRSSRISSSDSSSSSRSSRGEEAAKRKRWRVRGNLLKRGAWGYEDPGYPVVLYYYFCTSHVRVKFKGNK